MAAKLDDGQLAALLADARSGQFSNVELGRQYGISESYVRKILKANGVVADLAERVRHAAKEKAVRGSVRASATALAPSDDQIIEEASDRGATALQRHARIAGRGIEVAERLINRAADMLADIDQADAPKTEQQKMRTLAVVTRVADLGSKAMGVLDKAVTLERQALNLDDAPEDPPGGPISEIEIVVVRPEDPDA